MKETQNRMTVGLNQGLFKRLKEIADRRHCDVDELVEESVKSRYCLYSIEERLAAVNDIARMNLPVETWDKLEEEMIRGASEQ